MATNPESVRCNLNAWTKIGTNVSVTGGGLWRLSTKPSAYFYTYRKTGDPAPTGLREAVKIFVGNPANFEVVNANGIDIYIYASKKNGYVRLDI